MSSSCSVQFSSDSVGAVKSVKSLNIKCPQLSKPNWHRQDLLCDMKSSLVFVAFTNSVHGIWK